MQLALLAKLFTQSNWQKAIGEKATYTKWIAKTTKQIAENVSYIKQVGLKQIAYKVNSGEKTGETNGKKQQSNQKVVAKNYLHKVLYS